MSQVEMVPDKINGNVIPRPHLFSQPKATAALLPVHGPFLKNRGWQTCLLFIKAFYRSIASVNNLVATSQFRELIVANARATYWYI